jgi:hypothetical protein
MNLNPLQELLIEARLAEAASDHDQRAWRYLAEGAGPGDAAGLRATLGRWLVQAGLWLDPRASEGTASAARTPEAGQRA